MPSEINKMVVPEHQKPILLVYTREQLIEIGNAFLSKLGATEAAVQPPTKKRKRCE